MNWLIFFGAWALLIVLFCWGNKRWGDRMARLDQMELQAHMEWRAQQHKQFGRKYS